MITLDDYYRGYNTDPRYIDELTAAIRIDAATTVKRANALLSRYYSENLSADHAHVTSGWRPKAVNAAIPTAAKNSKHMIGRAIDLSDPEGDLDEWCMGNQNAMAECDLWLEHPSSTKGWSHWQIVPPASGKRVFYP